MAANPAGLGFLTTTDLDVSLNASSAALRSVCRGQTRQWWRSRQHTRLLLPMPHLPQYCLARVSGDRGVFVCYGFLQRCRLALHRSSKRAWQKSRLWLFKAWDKSEIVVLRTAAGAGITLSPQWSVGANFGLDYNQNTLQAPYIFQNAPGLKGDKVLVDLRTSGFGWNAETGVLFRPREDLQFGLTYKSPTTIFSHGDASGNAGAQLGVSSYPFEYNADVKNVLPQMATGGVFPGNSASDGGSPCKQTGSTGVAPSPGCLSASPMATPRCPLQSMITFLWVGEMNSFIAADWNTTQQRIWFFAAVTVTATAPCQTKPSLL